MLLFVFFHLVVGLIHWILPVLLLLILFRISDIVLLTVHGELLFFALATCAGPFYVFITERPIADDSPLLAFGYIVPILLGFLATVFYVTTFFLGFYQHLFEDLVAVAPNLVDNLSPRILSQRLIILLNIVFVTVSCFYAIGIEWVRIDREDRNV